MTHALDVALGSTWPPVGLAGCRICGSAWNPRREDSAICESCWTWAGEFAAGRGRGAAPSPIEQLKKALRAFARGRQISEAGAQWVLDNFKRASRMKVDHCGTVLSLRGLRLRVSDDDRKRAGGAVFVVQMPTGEPLLVVRRPGSGGIAVPWGSR